MDDTIAVQIKNAKTRIGELLDLNSRFLAHVSERPDAERLPARLDVDGDGLVVDSFGHLAVASPRVVRAGSGAFAIEYVFRAKCGDDELELWRFYLISVGRLAETPEGETELCDYDNSIIADHICGRVLNAALESPLLQPSERIGG